MAVSSPPVSVVFAGYDDAHHPLGSYALLTVALNSGLAGFLIALSRSGKELPASVGVGDMALIGVATHKLSRLISKDRVTSFVRAPFTRYQESAGPSEVSEQPRGTGPRRAIGELLVCPYCVGQWVAAALYAGLLTAPRTTRFVSAMYASLTVSDVLQILYKAGQEQL
jgi:hypothetical protein